jgi:enamine deaminase RidA (YjgF/YER057c/UK114 family)
VGAGDGARAVAEQLAFLSDSGANALEGLVRQLEQRGSRAEDLLRLRAFVASSARASTFVSELEQVLPRERWPALTVVVQASTDVQARGDNEHAPTGGEAARDGEQAAAIEGEAVDAVVAAQAGGRRILGEGVVRFGDWVFVGAVDGEGAGIESQARSVFERMQAALAQAGTELREVVKVGGWLGFAMSEYEPLGRVRNELLAQSGLLPASSAVQVQTPCPRDASRLLAFEAVAFTAEEPHTRGRASPLASFYATARSADGYVFTCGEIPRAREHVEEQLLDVYEQLAEHLSEHEATLASTLAQTIYVRSGHDPRAVASEARSLLAPTEPSTTIVTVADMGFRPGVDVEVELIAQTGA